MVEDKQLFRNTTQGHVGVVLIDRRGERTAIAVAPGETVWLSEEEREVTARAPREARHNPFIDQPYELRDNNGEVIETGSRPPLVPDTEDRPTGSEVAATTPPGDAPEGSYAAGEEVGVPQPVGFGVQP